MSTPPPADPTTSPPGRPVAAVVGATGGLGSALTTALHDAGYDLVLAGRDADRLAAAAPIGATTVTLDVRDPAAGDALVRAVTAGPGRLDLYVNAAGIVAFGALADTDDVVIEELFLTNVMGPLWLLRRVTPLLEATGGVAVQLSAVVAETPLPDMAAYAASKAALTAADAAVARELRRRGVRVLDVRPPHTETGLAGRAVAGTAPPLPRGLDPEVVAARILAAVADGRSTAVPSEAFAP